MSEGAGHFFPRRRGEPLQGILQRALDRHGLSRRLDRLVPRAVWAEAVGAELAARVQPTVLSRGTLHLLVQDHRWRDQIDAARALVIERLNRRLGKHAVQSLQFGLAHEGALGPAAAAARACAALDTGPVAPTRGGRSDDVSDLVLRAAEASRRHRRV